MRHSTSSDICILYGDDGYRSPTRFALGMTVRLRAGDDGYRSPTRFALGMTVRLRAGDDRAASRWG